MRSKTNRTVFYAAPCTFRAMDKNSCLLASLRVSMAVTKSVLKTELITIFQFCFFAICPGFFGLCKDMKNSDFIF